MKKITVYSTSSCPYCVMVKSWLKKNNIGFTEYMVDQNPIAAQNMVRLSGQRGVPFTTIEEDNSIQKIVGYDITRLEKLIGAGI